MQKIELKEGQELPEKTVLTIGNFDGIHLGHRELFKSLIAQAKSHQCKSAVLTFFPHPVQVLYPERHLERMFDLRDMEEVAEGMGVDFLIEQKFDLHFAHLSAVDFMQKFVLERLKAQFLVVGYDFNFGRGREGDLGFITRFCQSHQMGLEIVPPFQVAGMTVSSSKIRNELKLGDLDRVRAFLGRNYYLRGTVIQGFQRGRTIGVPTANIKPNIQFVPRLGVYASEIWIGNQKYQGITNIGVNPTVSNNRDLKVETHLFSFSQDIYNQEIRVELLKFIRDEKKFSSVDVLKQQIDIDIALVKEWMQRGEIG